MSLLRDAAVACTYRFGTNLTRRTYLRCGRAGRRGKDMTFIYRVRRAAVAMLTGAIVVFGVLSAPIMVAALTPAAAQISEDAQIALEQYGSGGPHPRFGHTWGTTAMSPE